ncbi:MAG: response regulator, partial [Bacteroidaceae bacterium]|nr:response regulator [Bacteroidaceae bacterium]
MHKILLIEDDKMIADSISRHLTQWGYEVHEIEDFSNVLSEVTRVSPDLILLDIMLPNFNGFYWCKEIRKLYKMPIIFLSSASDNMNIVMAMDMGGDDF